MKKRIKEYRNNRQHTPLTDEELKEWSKLGFELVGFAIDCNENLKYHYIFAKEDEEEPKKKKNIEDNNEDAEFIEMIYSIYPQKCPKRGSSLGKCSKDKDRIKKLLKNYTKEQIEEVVRREIDSKYGISYMQNFSTFLNNFPDPIVLWEGSKKEQKDDKKVVIGGVIYK